MPKCTIYPTPLFTVLVMVRYIFQFQTSHLCLQTQIHHNNTTYINIYYNYTLMNHDNLFETQLKSISSIFVGTGRKILLNLPPLIIRNLKHTKTHLVHTARCLSILFLVMQFSEKNPCSCVFLDILNFDSFK